MTEKMDSVYMEKALLKEKLRGANKTIVKLKAKLEESEMLRKYAQKRITRLCKLCHELEQQLERDE